MEPYDLYAEAYRDWWAPVIAPGAVGLLDRLDGVVPPDARPQLLDVGTGTGTLALAALERWPRATATAIDSSRRMLELASEEAQRRGDGIANRLHLVSGTASAIPLPDASVDLAISSFVIQLVPSRIAALREMLRTLRRGGLCAVLTWQDDDEWFEPDDVVDDVFDELGIEIPEGGRDPRPYTSPEAAAAEFRRAGFGDVRAERSWLEHRFTADGYVDLLEHWTEDEVFARLDAPRVAELRGVLLERLTQLDPRALAWRRPLVSVLARRPHSR